MGQINAAADESPPGELARFGHAGAGPKHQFENSVKHRKPTVAIDLDHVFPSVGGGGAHEADKYFIDGLTRARFNDVAVVEVVGLDFLQGTGLTKQLAANGPRLGAADFDDADASGPNGCGDGGNGIVKELSEFHDFSEPPDSDGGWAEESDGVVCFSARCSFFTGKTTTLRNAPSPLLLVRTWRSSLRARWMIRRS